MVALTFGLLAWAGISVPATAAREYAGAVEVSWPDDAAGTSTPEASPSKAPTPPAESEPVEPVEPVEPIDSRRRAELDFELSGLVGAVITHRTGGFTFGGPRFGFRVGHFSMGLSFYPSLLYSTYRDRHRIRPGLGFGLEIAYRGVTLFAPVYHIEDRYLPAFGIGYRFHLIRTVRRRQRNDDNRRRSRSRDDERPGKQSTAKP